LGEVLTETIDVHGATEPIERTVKAVALGPNAWLEPAEEIRVRIDIQPAPPPETGPSSRRKAR
jgi:hypothetical protein